MNWADFLNADNGAIIFGQTDNLLFDLYYSLNTGGPLQLYFLFVINPLSANPRKWSNTLKQFVGHLPTNYLSVIDHFVKLAQKGLICLSKLRVFERKESIKLNFVWLTLWD